MKTVTFNGLNLKFQINSIAINIFGMKIKWYAILIVTSILIGIIYCIKNKKKLNFEVEDICILAIIIMLFSFFGARLYYVIFSLNKYLNNPLEIFAINNGGLAIYGGIIGAIIGIYIYCKKTKRPFLKVLDFIVVVLPLGQAIGRWGNFFNVEAYGMPTNSIFRMGIIENGKYIEVHPTFLYESVICFIIFLILNFKKTRTKYDGQLCLIYLLFYGISRAFIETLRTDSLMFANFKVSKILSILISLFAFFILLFNFLKKEKETKKEM